MKIMITGSAGFIGSALALKLVDRGDEVIGVDNLNDYYDINLKKARLSRHINHNLYKHHYVDIEDREKLELVFKNDRPDIVVNLAAQAGVRYSIENPMAYVNTNLLGFANILEGCRNFNVKHLVYASSSSVYGSNSNMPFSVHDNVDHPLSLYAATKKSNELMAHTYSHLYNLPSTGLRFFTVYGPWWRPDMALFKFTKSIINGEEIPIFNYGKHKRDFTYIDDIVLGIIKVIDSPASPSSNWNSNDPDPGISSAPWRIYNIGNNNPVDLMDYVAALENCLGIEAKKKFLPLQDGDVPDTYADVESLIRDFNYKPDTKIVDGVKNFVNWYKDFYECW